jgi:hypothetical protein
MLHCRINTPSDALAYLLDCTLATVERLAMQKKKSKYEYKRQIGIAQKNLDWCVMFNADVSDTRAEEIVKGKITVEQWAKMRETRLIP